MTTGVLCPTPVLSFTLNNGTLAVNGSILTQIGGVNAATYEDSALTTPLPNPIPLNARGEVSDASGTSRQLFLTPNVIYTFTLFDGPGGTGNQIWSQTYINGVQNSQSSIGQLLFPQTSAETLAGITPTNYYYPTWDVRRMGVVGDGVTDDTAALQRCYTVGGEWWIAPGLSLNITSTIVGVIATHLYSDTAVTPIPGGSPASQVFLLHNFSGTFFDLQGSSSNQKTGAGFGFSRVSFVQQNGNGSGASGTCIRSVQLSGTQECPWLRIRDCHFETGVGTVNDWTYCIVLDGTNQVNPLNLRDCFISGCRFVSGTHATASVLFNGVSNIWIRECEGNLANSNLVITGSDASHLSLSIVVSDTAWNAIQLDFAQGVYGSANQTGTFTSTGNTIDVFLETTVNVSQTILGTRVTIVGKAPSGKSQWASNNNVRFETGAAPVEVAQILAVGTNPATSGDVRLNNSAVVSARNAANSGDIMIIGVDNSNRVEISGSGATIAALGPLIPASAPAVLGTSQLWSGSGGPSGSLGNNGDYYLRSDTPGTANQRIYVKSSGSWVGIA